MGKEDVIDMGSHLEATGTKTVEKNVNNHTAREGNDGCTEGQASTTELVKTRLLSRQREKTRKYSTNTRTSAGTHSASSKWFIKPNLLGRTPKL